MQPSLPIYRTGNQSLVREINLSLILQHLRRYGPTSRAELAKLIGLAKPSVSSLIRDLQDRGFVIESGATSAGLVGRPSLPMQLNPLAGYIVSADLGVDSIQAICSDFAAEVLWRDRVTFAPDESQAAIIERLVDLLRRAAAAGKATCGRGLGLSLGVPGLMDPQRGILRFAPNLGWRDVPIAEILAAAFDLPIHVYNESYLGALAEHHRGAAQNHDQVLYIAADIGLGGTLIQNGDWVGSAIAFPGRFGHMTMDPNGDLCACGNRGCWETQVSRKALTRLVRRSLAAGRPSLLAAASEDRPLPIDAVLIAAAARDTVACDVLTDVGHSLGIGIASLVNALNPQVVVLGKMLGLAYDYLLPAVHEELEHHVLCWSEGPAHIVPSKLGYDATLLGGVAKVYESILPSPAATLRTGRYG